MEWEDTKVAKTEINSKLMVDFIKDLYRLKSEYKFRCLIHSTLLEYNIAIFVNENQLMDILSEHHVDMIDIISHPTEFRLYTKDIKTIDIENNVIKLEMNDTRTVRIKLDNKK